MKKLFAFIITLIQIPVFAQEAAIPTIIAFPSNQYMNLRNYGTKQQVNGREVFVPDYNKVFLEDAYLKTALSEINGALKDRGYEVEVLESKLLDIDDQAAMDIADDAYISIADQVMDAAKPDIRLNVEFYVSSQLGPRKGWTVKFDAVDAYTNSPVANINAVVDPSSDVPDLVLKKVITGHIDDFSSQLMAYFQDLHDKGRKVNVTFRTTENGPNLEEDEINGNPFNEFLEDWLKKYALNHSSRTMRVTPHAMSCVLRIPFFDEEGLPLETKQWVRPLRNELKNGLGVPATLKLRGLGRVEIMLGNK